MKHLESDLQKNCITWFRLQYPKLARLIFAVPNGGRRNAREAAIMKAEGVTAGVADVILLVGSNGFNSLCIEFKTKKGKQTDFQKKWQQEAEKHANKYVVCRSFDEFRLIVHEYFNQTAMTG